MTDASASPVSVPAVTAVLLAVLGTLAMGWSFVNGVNAALDGSGGGATAYVVVFLVAGAAVVAAIVIGIVGLVRRRSRILSALAIVIGLVPVVGVIVLRIAAIS